MKFSRRFSTRAISLAGAGAAGLGVILSLGSSGGATPSDTTRPLVAPQPAVRSATHRLAPSRHPRATASCSGAASSGPGAFDSTSQFSTNKSNTAAFGGSNLAAAGYAGVFEGSANTICDYNSVIVGGYTDTIDSGAGNTPAGAAYSMIGAGEGNDVSNGWAFIGAGSGNTVSNQESFIGAGTGGSVSAYQSFIGAGGGNAVSGFDSFVGAGLGNAVPGTVSFIGGGHNNSVSGHLSFVGDGFGNQVSGPGSFIGAGGDLTAELPDNQIAGSDSFIGAGDLNTVSANDSFVGSGYQNAVTEIYGAIAGGYRNNASGAGASVGGGEYNNAAGTASVVGGGVVNAARGAYATIPGGYENAANGNGSFAAGTLAKARNIGSFVWSDNSTGSELQSTVNYQFLARATGGFYLYSNKAATVGVKLAPNSGTWASLSDRTMKSGVVPLDDAAVLAKVAALPISEWSYRDEGGVRHVGPMAQDFYAAFRVGEDDRHITSIDEDGVALAAIKALRRENVALRAGMRSQNAEIVELQGEVRELEAKFVSTQTR